MADSIGEQFVDLLAKQDFQSITALFAPQGVWEVHVPGWDALVVDRLEMVDVLTDFFGRLDFQIARHEVIQERDRTAITMDLLWRDRQSDLPAASFQSHHFMLVGDKILRHQMYCAGVRIYQDHMDRAATIAQVKEVSIS